MEEHSTEDISGTPTESSFQTKLPRKINYRDEIITLFYNAMLDVIIDEYILLGGDNVSEKGICDPKTCVCSKSFKDLNNDDLQMPIMNIIGSVVSLGQKNVSEMNTAMIVSSCKFL